MEEDGHETEPVERWPDDVLRDDHEVESVERWPDDVLRDDHLTLDDEVDNKL